MAARAQTSVQVNPADTLTESGVLAQHAAQGLVTPGRAVAAVKHAVGKLVLTLSDGRLVSQLPLSFNETGNCGLVSGVWWPVLGHDERMQGAIGGVVGQRLSEVLKVTVQVYVFMRGAAKMRKAVRVQSMDVQHGCA